VRARLAAIREFDLDRPEGVSRRDYRRFRRSVRACVWGGHVAPMLLHKQERSAHRPNHTKLTLREACARCGLPLVERVQDGQMPRRRELDAWMLN
jgi:hypothetical protein